MIRAQNVTKIFGPGSEATLALLEQGYTKDQVQRETGHVVGISGASFAIEPGEVFCIMGLSGSGKSTLIRCINRLIEPTAGRIYLADPDHGEREITAMSAGALRSLRQREVSMVFQHFALFPHRTVLSNAIFGLEIQGRDPAESRRRGRQVLELVGLEGWGDAYPHALSGGMQQRVGLARGLATEAKVLLMDEPFSALDPLIRVNMQQELVRIQSELGRTILFITHDLDEAMRIGRHIAIMDAGTIVQIGTPEEILVNPQTEYVANFVEHADPTSVLRARTIALPFRCEHLERVREENGIRYFARRGDPRVEFGVDADKRLHGIRAGERRAEVRALDDVLAAGGDAGRAARRSDLALRCAEDTVLRTLLRGRLHATLPTVVTDRDGRVRGIIDEPELVGSILEKRGYGAGTP